MVGEAPMATLLDQRERSHDGCWVCGSRNEDGLRVDFRADAKGQIEGSFDCPERYRGYAGYVHGGIVSSLLDGAMTNCLMARGQVSVTADLTVRFRRPVRVGLPARVRAWLDHERHGLQVVEAELTQGATVCATARARFLAHPEEGGSQGSAARRPG